MKRPTGRRNILMAAGAAVLAAAAGPAAAQPMAIRGAVIFAGGTAIPEGHIEIYLEDTAIQDRTQRRVAQTRVESDGASKTIGFSVAPPANLITSPTLQIIARLTRADGWLVARGSAPLTAGTPVAVTLNTAMY